MRKIAEELELSRLLRVKRAEEPGAVALGPEVVGFFKQSVQRRQTKLGKIAESWGKLVPRLLEEHTALHSYNRGSLTVIVDSSAHLYDLKHLLLAGLEQQLFLACRSSGLRRIVLKPGTWYAERRPARR